jgi:hypothetical protein
MVVRASCHFTCSQSLVGRPCHVTRPQETVMFLDQLDRSLSSKSFVSSRLAVPALSQFLFPSSVFRSTEWMQVSVSLWRRPCRCKHTLSLGGTTRSYHESRTNTAIHAQSWNTLLFRKCADVGRPGLRAPRRLCCTAQ